MAMLLFFAGLVLMGYPHIKGEQLETEAAESIVQFVESRKQKKQTHPFPSCTRICIRICRDITGAYLRKSKAA